MTIWSNEFVGRATRCTGEEVVNARDVGEKITVARATDLAHGFDKSFAS